MTGGQHDDDGELTFDAVRAADSVDDIARILRQLRRREARRRGDSPLTYRELAAKTGWAHGVIGDYFSGRTLAPTDRFDVLTGLLGAAPQELGALATARDRVEENRRKTRHSGGTPRAVPHQLPAPAAGFVGREDVLARADELLDGGVRIFVFSGTAGVGKTALALQWARRVEGAFPGGSLYADLRGYGSAEPMTPEAALVGFLRTLGVSEVDLAGEVGELAARFRSLLAGQRMIIMLDNARGAEQVRPLLPGTTSSLILVTSRDQLAGLVARDGAHRFVVPLLPADDAVRLLGPLVGARVGQDIAAASALAERCSRLPLALRIAAELAARRPSARIGDLVGELDAAPRSLDLLDAGGDTETAVRQIFSWSYRNLSAEAAACFRALGLFPGTHFAPAAVSALTAAAPDAAMRSLDELVRTSLVEQRPGPRYTMHDLLRAYAREQADDDPAFVPAATARLLTHYLQTSATAVATLYPAELSALASADTPTPPESAPIPPHPPTTAAHASTTASHAADTPPAPTSPHPPTTPSHASTTAAHAADTPPAPTSPHPPIAADTPHATALPQPPIAPTPPHATTTPHSLTEPQPPTALTEVTEVTEPQAALAWLDAELPTIVVLSQQSLHSGHFTFATGVSRRLWPYLDRSGRYPEAMAIHGSALTAARRLGDARLEAAALGELGQANARLGRYRQALDHLHPALELSRRTDDRARAATTLNSLAIAYSRLGRTDEAIEHLRLALAEHRALGNRVAEGKALSNLGIEYAQIGRLQSALDHFALALDIARDRGDRYGEGNALNNLGLVACWLGRYEDALHHHGQGLACARASGDRAGEGRVLANLGVAHTRIGDHREALACLTEAMRIHQEVGDRAAEAETLSYLGDLSQATGANARALQQHREALGVATEIGYRHAHAPAHNGSGRALSALGRRDEAEASFAAGLEAAEQAGDRLQRAHALAGLARCHATAGRTTEARELWHRAAAIYAELGVPELHAVRAEIQALPPK